MKIGRTRSCQIFFQMFFLFFWVKIKLILVGWEFDESLDYNTTQVSFFVKITIQLFSYSSLPLTFCSLFTIATPTPQVWMTCGSRFILFFLSFLFLNLLHAHTEQERNGVWECEEVFGQGRKRRWTHNDILPIIF